MGRAEDWKRHTSQYWYGQPKEVQAAHRKEIGGDFLEAKPNGLFRGNECLAGESYLDWNWSLPHGMPVMTRDLRYVPREILIHKCGCGRFFLDWWSVKICLACRKAAQLAKLRAYTTERAKVRAERRANPPTRPCANCGDPILALRSTKRFCSADCRQADSRKNRKPVPKPAGWALS